MSEPTAPYNDPFLNQDLPPETPDEVFARKPVSFRRFNRAWHEWARESSTPEEDSP